MSGSTKNHFLRHFSTSMVALFFAALGILSVAAGFINPSKVPFVSFFSLLYVPLLAINIILFVICVIRKKYVAWICLISVLLAGSFSIRYYKFGGESEAPLEGDYFSIVSWNVDHFGQGREVRAEKMTRAFELLDSLDADIICLQEFPKSCLGAAKQHFRGYKVAVSPEHVHRQLVLSRIKHVGQSGQIPYSNTANSTAFADFTLKGHTFRVYSNHLESYAKSPYKILRSMFRLDKDELEKTGNEMQVSSSRRSGQVDKLIDHIEGAGVKHIVCGDFNDTPLSYTYSRLRRDHRDTFVKCGSGWGGTYSFMWPLLRIDYIFCSPSFTPLSYKCLSNKDISDHYPIITYFKY